MSRLILRRRHAVAGTVLSLAVLAGAAIVLYPGGQRQAVPTQCVARAPGSDDPTVVTRRFLMGAVERRDLRDAFNVVTPGFRGGESCGQWLAHPRPAKSFRIDWSRAAYKLNPAGGEGQTIYDVILYRPGGSRAFHYLIELRKDDGHSWRVAGWYPSGSSDTPTPVA